MMLYRSDIKGSADPKARRRGFNRRNTTAVLEPVWAAHGDGEALSWNQETVYLSVALESLRNKRMSAAEKTPPNPKWMLETMTDEVVEALLLSLLAWRRSFPPCCSGRDDPAVEMGELVGSTRSASGSMQTRSRRIRSTTK